MRKEGEKTSEPDQIVFNQVLLKWDAARSVLVMDPKRPEAGYYQIFMFPPDLHARATIFISMKLIGKPG